jgi:Tol biopolymer transport system component
LEHGPLPFNESLSISLQIAQALEEAHEKGIVHRDLKPQNVKASIEGKVKVLDFGLAKAMDPAVGSAASAVDLARSPTMMNSPTLTAAHGTEIGMILGTAAYMAPEQARGTAVDKRADIWAFGVVLYEMLTGASLFGEGSVVDTLSAVMRKEIELDRLPLATPARLRDLVRRCLERDPRRRLRDIGDARIVLEELREGRGAESVSVPGKAARLSPAKLIGTGALALAALVAAVVVGRRTAPAATGAAADSGAGFRQFTHLTYQSGLESSPALSPDGEFVAYAAIDGGDRDIFLLRVGGQRAINLTEDSAFDDDHPAFSPDGRSVAFRSERDGGGLFVMGATGESVRRLTTFGDNPSWSPDGGEIVFATEGASDPHNRQKTSELWTVPAAGGEPRKLFAGDAIQPAWSPHGQRIAFWGVDIAKGSGLRDVWTIAADGSDPQRVTDSPSVDWDPVWERDGGHLRFVSNRNGVFGVWRVAIDERTGSPNGEPQPIVLPTSSAGQISLSGDERRMVYRTSEMTAEIRRLPFDARAGKLTGPAERLFDTALPAVGLDLSADGWMLFRTAAIQEDLYMMRIDGGGLRKLTDDAAKDRVPVWSPDGSQAVFYSNRSGRYEIWTVNRDGSNLRQRTSTSGGQGSALLPVWSPDGRSIAYSFDNEVVRFTLRDEPVPNREMETVPVDRGDAEQVFLTSWSPDGRKLAGVRIGKNGQLLAGLLIHDLPSGRSQFVAVPPPVPPGRHAWPTLSWLPDSRRGVIRWGDRLLLVDTANGSLTTLAAGFNRDGGVARVSGDGRWLYMVDSREEGDLWMASTEPPTTSQAGSGSNAAAGARP